MSLKRVSKGKRKPLLASVVSENHGPCAFCQLAVDDEISYGKLYAIGDIQCHYFCALLSCCLIQKGKDEEGLFGFLYPDIVAEVERSRKHRCSYCSKGGAGLGCSVTTCKKQFHLPCGRQHKAVSLFFGNYKSFCVEHAPKQKIPEHIMGPARAREKATKVKGLKAPKNLAKDTLNEDNETSEETVCVICYEEVQGFPTVDTFWPPCCGRDAWFHRSCLQRMALSAGMHYLKCPLCNDKDTFYEAVVDQGYYVPDRDAAWELEQNAFAEIYERPLACAADNCQCPNGREHDTDSGPWDIKMCILCGTIGMHAQCLSEPNQRFMCVTCEPLAPEDIETFTTAIEQEILREQARKAAENVPKGPVMPSRMSLRRTKPRNIALPSTSRLKKDEAAGIAQDVQTTVSSRLELNLKTPRRCTVNSDTPDPVTDNTLTTPIKLFQQGLNEKLRTMDVKELPVNLDSDKMIAELREQFKKPRPRCEKVKIVNAILQGLFDNVLKDNKVKSPIKKWISPKKFYESPKKSKTLLSDTKNNESKNANIENFDVSSKIKYSGDSPSEIENIAPKKKPTDNLILMHTEILGDTVNEVHFEDIKEIFKGFEHNDTINQRFDNLKRPIGKILLKFDENTHDNDENLDLSDEIEMKKASKHIRLSPKFNLENECVVTEKDANTKPYTDKKSVKTSKNRNKLRKSFKNTPQSSDRTDTPIRKTRNNTPKSKSLEEIILKDYQMNLNDTPKGSKNKRNKKTLADTLNVPKTDPISKILEIYDDDSEDFEKEARFVKKVNHNGDKTKKNKSRRNRNNRKSEKKSDVNSVEADDLLLNMEDDESSWSTFELPPEFIAGNNSDESIPFLETPKKLKTVEIEKDSSLEISENDSAVNIDMIKIERRFDKEEFLNSLNLRTPVETKTEKELLYRKNIEVDHFKSHYLNEVGKLENEVINNQSDTENKSEETVIDFNIDAYRDRKKLKRKLKTKSEIAKKRFKNKRNKNIALKLENSKDSNLEIVCPKNDSSDLTVESIDKRSERRRKKLKKKNKMFRDNIRLKIRLKITKSSKKSPKNDEKIKKKVCKSPKNYEMKNVNKSPESPTKFKQYILKYPTETSNKMICKPDVAVSPKKRSYTKLEKTPDHLIQTSIQSFFKLKPKD